MNKLIAFIFAGLCFATSALSNSIMGSGVWYWVIIATGIFVAVSQYLPILRGAGAGMALLLSIVSICAVLFGLVAATIGGSFRLDDEEALLLFLFLMMSAFGFMIAIAFNKSIKNNDRTNT